MENEFKDFAFDIDEKAIMEDGTFRGFASTFGGKADSFGDVIQPGAFTNTLKKGGRNGNGIVMLKFHDSQLIPGVWDKLSENAKGLKAEGSLLIDTQLGRETHIQLTKKAIKGLSIGFHTLESDPNPKVKFGRIIKEVELFEVSIVAFPANTRATITSVKQMQDIIMEAKSKRELEHSLREAVGLSKDAAKYLISKLKEDWREANSDEKFVEKPDLTDWKDVFSSISQVKTDMEISRMIRS